MKISMFNQDVPANKEKELIINTITSSVSYIGNDSESIFNHILEKMTTQEPVILINFGQKRKTAFNTHQITFIDIREAEK